MSDISINRYIERALDSGSGEIRLAKGTTDELVNKGTFLNKLATKLGMGDVESQGHRSQAALKGFRDALTDSYGKTIADEALGKAGLLGQDARLTGSRVMQAVDEAKSQAAQFRTNTRTAFEALKNELPDDLGDEGKTQLRTSLNQALMVEYDFGRKDVTPERAREVYDETLATVRQIVDGGHLERAKELQDGIRQDLQATLRDLARPRTPEQLLQRLNDVEAKLDELLELEGKGDASQEMRDARLQQAFHGAIGDANRADLMIGLKAQRGALRDESALRALYAGAKELSITGGSTERETALHTMKQCEMLVRALSHPMARTGSAATDIALLRDGDGVSPNLKLAGRTALAGTIEFVNGDPQGGQAFLTGLKNDPRYQGADETGRHAWHTADVLKDLGRELQAYQQQSGRPLHQCVADFRAAISADREIAFDLGLKLLAGLDAIDAEGSFTQRVSQQPEFEGIAPDDMWRLFATGHHQDDNPQMSKWDVEHYGEGSMAGMQRAFEEMLRARENHVPLTAQHLDDLHTIATRNGTTHNAGLQATYTHHEFGNDEQRQMNEEMTRELRTLSVIPSGMRELGAEYTLRLDVETTQDGLDELHAYATSNPQWFSQVAQDGDDALNVKLSIVGPGATAERADAILTAHRNAIGNAHTDDEKRSIIADTVQQLYRSHLTEDANTRTMVFTTMNRLLLDAGLSPAILREPKAAGGFSHQQFVEEIRQGQQRFQALKERDHVQNDANAPLNQEPVIEPPQRDAWLDELSDIDESDDDFQPNTATLDAGRELPPKIVPEGARPFLDDLLMRIPDLRSDATGLYRFADLQNAVWNGIDKLVQDGLPRHEAVGLIREAVTDNPTFDPHAESEILTILKQEALSR